MKIYKYCLIIFSVIFFFACEKETEGISRITYYVDLELKGNSTEFVNLGGTYIEPGWTAIEEGSDVSENVTVSGTVDTSKPGLYTLNYLVYNADGFPKTAQRQVVVSDPTPSPLESGFYKVSKLSNRTSLGSGPGSAGSKEYASEPLILIYQVSPAKFYISDFIGGYYEVGRGYGPAYALKGHFTLNPDNTLTANDSFLAGWGDSLDDLINATYDPATKTLTYTAQYAGAYDFNIIATKL
jgi:hypothetical protein